MSTNAEERDTAREFGRWLKDQLKARNLTQEEFAERIGMNQGTISTWITGARQRPTMPSCRRIARGLGLPEREVLRRAGHRVRDVPPVAMIPEPADESPAAFLNDIFSARGTLSQREKEQIRAIVAAYFSIRD